MYGTAVTLENCFLSATRNRTVALGYRGRRTLATAGILVFLDAGCIYVRLQVHGEVYAIEGHLVCTSYSHEIHCVPKKTSPTFLAVT